MTTLNKSPTDSVVSPGVVVGGILLAAYQLLGVEQLSVGPSSNLVDHCRLQIDENSPKHKKKNSVRSLPGHQCYREATFLGGSGSPEFREPTPVLTKLGRLQLQAKKNGTTRRLQLHTLKFLILVLFWIIIIFINCFRP